MREDRDVIRQAEHALLRLGFDVSQLRAENRRLRRLVANRGQGRIISRARDDAIAMLTWRFAGFAITRRACMDLGLSERRWEWARALLWAARVHDGQDVTEDDFELAVRIVDRTAQKLMKGDDMVPLTMRRRRRDRRHQRRV